MPLSVADQLMNLRDISPTVSNYLEGELFKEDYGFYGDFTAEDVLQQCYCIIVQELAEYGIHLEANYSDLLGDWYTANHIYCLRKWISSEYQLDLLKTYLDDADYLASILDAEGVDPTDVLLSYLEHAKGVHPDDELVNDMDYITPWLVADERFIQHVQGLLDYLKESGTQVVVPDVERASKYITKIQQGRDYVTQAVKQVIRLEPPGTFNQRKIDKLLRDYDLDKISPENIKIFSSIDLDEVPEFLIPFKNQQLDIHHKCSQHHIEYWTDPAKDPKPIPTLENVLLLVAHHYEPGTTPADFFQEVNEMLDKAGEALTPEQVTAAQRYAQLIMDQPATLSAGLDANEGETTATLLGDITKYF